MRAGVIWIVIIGENHWVGHLRDWAGSAPLSASPTGRIGRTRSTVPRFDMEHALRPCA